MPTDSLGAWEGDNLKSTLEEYEGVSYYADMDDITRFLHGIAKLINKRLARDSEESKKKYPAVFILGKTPDLRTIRTIRVPRLNSGLCQLSGYVWFVSREPNAGNGVEACFDDDELFDFVIKNLNVGGMPTVLFDAKESVRSMRFYPKGLSEMKDCKVCEIDSQNVTPAEVKNTIDRIHGERFLTPEAGDSHLKLWNDKEKCYPTEHSESVIQSHLVTGLSAHFLSCKVKQEQTGVSGRYDIAIKEQSPLDGRWTHHAILELKVIRSFTCTGTAYSDTFNNEWLKSGMEQAYSYQKENGSNFSALCCFDMQKDDNGCSCFNHIEEKARELVVELWRWYIYSTSSAYRTAQAAR